MLSNILFFSEAILLLIIPIWATSFANGIYTGCVTPMDNLWVALHPMKENHAKIKGMMTTKFFRSFKIWNK